MAELIDSNTVQQLHVIFRHGSRNPEASHMYPKDPHINDKWAPEGLGQLTTAGKMKVYDIGRYLRKRYDTFLGSVYTPDVIFPISTEFDRTKMSLQLVLAGLYTPVKFQIWNEELLWQPIPYDIVPTNSDYMRVALFHCPKYIEMFKELENSDYVQNFHKTNADLIQHIKEHTGLKDELTIANLMKLNDALLTEEQTGRKLPAWTKKVYPEFLNKVVHLFFEIKLYNNEMIKLSAGAEFDALKLLFDLFLSKRFRRPKIEKQMSHINPLHTLLRQTLSINIKYEILGHLLKKILKDMIAKKEETIIPKDRKIFLYSGHDFNVAYILSALNVFKTQPPYASFVILELHLINNVYGIKILYQDYKQEEPKYLTIPGCDTFCPLDKLLILSKPIIPNDTDI